MGFTDLRQCDCRTAKDGTLADRPSPPDALIVQGVGVVGLGPVMVRRGERVGSWRVPSTANSGKDWSKTMVVYGEYRYR